MIPCVLKARGWQSMGIMGQMPTQYLMNGAPRNREILEIHYRNYFPDKIRRKHQERLPHNATNCHVSTVDCVRRKGHIELRDPTVREIGNWTVSGSQLLVTSVVRVMLLVMRLN